MDSTADSNTQLVYQAVSQNLADVGIRADIKTYEHTAWLDLRISGEMDSFIARWGMDYNDPANIMHTFFGSARVAAASAIVDDDERKAEYQALEKKIISEDAAWIPMLEDLHLYCLGERVESFVPHWAGFSNFFASDVTLR